MITRDDVRGAYRYLLGREPESEEVLDAHIAAVSDLGALRARFLAAPEFYRTNSRDLLRHFAVWQAQRQHGAIEYDCDHEALSKLFAHIKAVWSRLGEIEPHFSVHSTVNFKPDSIQKNMDAFLRSGYGETRLLVSELKGLGLREEGYERCVELGCGVGRVTRYLAEIAETVTGFDISKPHLDLANEYIEREKLTNIKLELLNEPGAVVFPPCDLFYSRIVLQHNPPPISRLLIGRALDSLEPGGVAVFQIPTYIEGYSFSIHDYLSDMDSLDNQELHALPQQAVFAAIEASGCDLLSVYRDNSLSSVTQVSNRFVVRKRWDRSSFSGDGDRS